MSKVCICCTRQLPIEMYYKHSMMRDGTLNKCKDCCRQAATAVRRANLEELRAYDRSRGNRQPPEYVKEYREANPEKYKAHNAVNNAIRDGRLVRQPCEVCGKRETHGHHDDYAKPLDVRWLCPAHHRQWHVDNPF